eukprot:TRINITY_DN220_c0_g1_i1.p1 TRINITY_DN220_c0_g1~~TRINITY_DN220_c0_g1_i1.p1  ORF type:complete len:749 (+),score=172.41 TRINITY_DN220_c0_g1_i1:83-2329(+)
MGALQAAHIRFPGIVYAKTSHNQCFRQNLTHFLCENKFHTSRFVGDKTLSSSCVATYRKITCGELEHHSLQKGNWQRAPLGQKRSIGGFLTGSMETLAHPSCSCVTSSACYSAGAASAVMSEPVQAKPAAATDGKDGSALGSGNAQGGSVLKLLAGLCKESLKANFPDDAGLDPMVAACANPKFGDYQFNNAMSIFAKVKGEGKFKNPRAVAEVLLKALPPSPAIKSTSIAGAGFVNLVVDTAWVEKRIETMLVEGMDSWAPALDAQRAVIDYSSPNIAKEMHVGHLRSTIIGDCIARMLDYCHVDVMRRNHVGDWGTQFGMLIQYLFDEYPNWEDIGDQAIGDLQAFYKKAKLKFDEDAAFKEKAQQAVVKLQGGDPIFRAAWTKICDVSRKEFQELYTRLKVGDLEEKGESFYNPYIQSVLDELVGKGLTTESDGALCVFFEGQEQPLIIRKRDGGFNYASTDLACLWYRLNEEKGDWIIYVTDVGQGNHFEMLFKTANKAGWIPDKWEKEGSKPRLSHVGFGLVLGNDGKRFRTRSTEVVRLADLLDEAKTRCHQGLVERVESLTGTEGAEDWTPQELVDAAEALGYGAVKYADLKQNRLTNYTFSFDQMLDMRGNTAVYLIYAHTRICSILRRSGKDIEALKKEGGLKLEHPTERALGMLLIRFPEMLEEAANNLLPNAVCDYLYQVSVLYSEMYDQCKVVGSPEENSRLLLVEATGIVMRKCFDILGITPLYRLPKAQIVPRP